MHGKSVSFLGKSPCDFWAWILADSKQNSEAQIQKTNGPLGKLESK